MALDVKRLSRNDQIVAGAGVLVLVLSLLDWYELKGSGGLGGNYPGASAWDMHFLGAKLGVILSILAAGWVLARAAGADTSMVKAPPRLIALALSVGAVLLLVIQRFRVENVEVFGVKAGWTIIYYIALLVAIAQAVFAYLAFQQDGGMNAVGGTGTTGTGGTGYGAPGGDYPPPPPTV